MLTLQKVGSEILSGNPSKFYVMVGCEYGVKEKYLNIIADHYSGRKKECQSVNEILSMMNTKRIIPLEPSLYVVRYDDEFISSLSPDTSSKIDSCKISGTVVCIYEDDKVSNKLDKYIPDYTVSIDKIDNKFILKYLQSDFPGMKEDVLKIVVRNCYDYFNAKSICNMLSYLNENILDGLSNKEISYLVGHTTTSKELKIKKAIASRNFIKMVNLCESIDDYSSLYYLILSVMVELEKISINKYAQSDLKGYEDRWKLEDIYNMFINTFDQLDKSRKFSVDAKNSVIYLLGLSQFTTVPGLEVMSNWN